MQQKSLLLITGLALCLSARPVLAQQAAPGFAVEGIGSQSIPLSDEKLTNIVFPVPILSPIRVSKDIQMQKVKGAENILVLKAAIKTFTPTNLAVYGQDGRLYSFDLHYVENPPVLNFKVVGEGTAEKMPLELDAEAIGGMDGFMHRVTRREKMELSLQGIWLRDGFLWFSFLLSNTSQIGYLPEHARYCIQDRGRLKRTAVQEISIRPVYENPLPVIPGDSSRMIIVCFRPFTLAKEKKLVIQLGEKSGGRDLMLTLRNTDLLKAKQL